MAEQRPLILFTNDDGIDSPGLWAVVHAMAHLGDRLVVAPKEQQSGTGRSLPFSSTGCIHPYPVEEKDILAFAVEGTPAQSVQHGVIEIADRKPSLIVSGINYGDNLGNGITISGTVGAALEGASMGIPSLAVSQQTPHDLHLTYSTEVDFLPAAHFASVFAHWMLYAERPFDLDILKIDVPIGANLHTEWRMTRLSRQRVYWPQPAQPRKWGEPGRMGYKLHIDPSQAEPDSDVYVLLHEKLVSVTPMSLDMSSRIDLDDMRHLFLQEQNHR